MKAVVRVGVGEGARVQSTVFATAVQRRLARPVVACGTRGTCR